MTRPATPILSKDIIADAALELVEKSGDLQMVALAKHLGVAPSSLYTHVHGRAEVIDLARSRILENIDPMPPEDDWRSAVERLLRQLATQYSRHLRLLPLIFATSFFNEKAISVYEPVFNSLLRAGFRPDQLRLIIALIDFQALGLAQGLPEPVMTENIRASLPGYTASVDHSQYSPSTSIDFSVEVILQGLEARLKASAAPEQTMKSVE
ncbi:TetR/AcrR family transcriptional regulator [Glutamicibacter sp. NPDC087344]|uniref:TetR/AcrR family transcriptional regulator n=1 Tax=Glutamicibacter sp. NPDC087344 TaxID=3363994 RepID=UPI0038175CB5